MARRELHQPRCPIRASGMYHHLVTPTHHHTTHLPPPLRSSLSPHPSPLPVPPPPAPPAPTSACGTVVYARVGYGHDESVRCAHGVPRQDIEFCVEEGDDEEDGSDWGAPPP